MSPILLPANYFWCALIFLGTLPLSPHTHFLILLLQKCGDEKLLHYASIRSYLCPTSLGTAWLMLMWSVLFFGPKLPAAAPPVIDKGAPSVTQHSSRFCCKETVSYLMCRRSPGTAGTLWTPYGWSSLCPIIRPSHATETSRANTQGQKQIRETLSCSGMAAQVSLLANTVLMRRG